LRDVRGRGQLEQALWTLVDVVGGKAADRPAGALPSRLPAGVFADIEVERSAVDLDNQSWAEPDEVGLFTPDPNVETRQGPPRVMENLHRSDFCAAAGALVSASKEVLR
jgi:hypothetical protein